MEIGEEPRHGPVCYRIRVWGALDPEWSDWFGGLAITHNADGATTLSGPVADQAALYGLLSRARDLGLTLLTVGRDEGGEAQPGPADAALAGQEGSFAHG
jgi:hypothetical protein